MTGNVKKKLENIEIFILEQVGILKILSPKLWKE